MLFVALKERRILNPVVLQVNVCALLAPGTRFSDRNAAAHSALISENPSVVRFDIALRTNPSGVPVADRPFFQAEVLIPSKISPFFITVPLPPASMPHPVVSMIPATINPRNACVVEPPVSVPPCSFPVPTSPVGTKAPTAVIPRSLSAARKPVTPPPSLAYFAYGDPCPPSPTRWTPNFEEPRCEFHIGHLPRCDICVPGLFVCPDHLVTCNAETAGFCSSCKRVLCRAHLGCFCADSELKRDEEKANRNRSIFVPFSPPYPPPFSSFCLLCSHPRAWGLTT